MGTEERERESRGGPRAAPRHPPQGTPVKRGREKQGRWDGIGVSTVECPGGIARSRKLDEQTVEKAVPWRCCGAPATAARVGAGLRCPGTLTGWHLRIWAGGCVLHLPEADEG